MQMHTCHEHIWTTEEMVKGEIMGNPSGQRIPLFNK